ncbi:related to Chromatin modification-related protein eaf3 [Cephalotrichum gorgonifer]|uniref:Chromatin modification-related protein EAF3 n=1 Tax=Cephalotrichum gorgonifer TaxID=2041049 RepID=A0AAE8SW91_9PEZI|nr:related to Chromatin modification-related protein eaf3 [Cephalotrichum gorgonifer]
MAPKPPPQPYAKDEKVLCFHHEMLYEAKVLDIQQVPDGGPDAGYQYKIHYKGWKATWDDWVPADRVRKHNPENVELAEQLMSQMRNLTQKSSASGKVKKGKAAVAESSRGSEERGGGGSQGGRGPRRTRDYELEQDEGFHSRPSIKLPIPDHIKSILVDDWENITKNNQLVPIPHPHPVSEIFEDYLAYERPHREEGSAVADILEETFAGLREYFEKSLPRILLYRFERVQYHEVREQWAKAKEGEPKCVTDTYGPEHLCRLLVSLEELIAQTNMDHQSVTRLREEIAKFTTWLTKNSSKYFVSQYETPSYEYAESTKF